jgi:dTMP kinase
MERKDLDYHRRVRDGYLAMAQADPGRWLVVDASQPPEAVQAAIRQRVATLAGVPG